MADEALAEVVDGLLHQPTQVRDGGIDLTVASVVEVEDPGRVDFGGGELEPAATAATERTKRDPDDEYGWWHLSPGGYLLEYNETLAATEPVLLQTREAVLDCGAFHPTRFVTELPRMPLAVGGAGIRLKENARVSTVRRL